MPTVYLALSCLAAVLVLNAYQPVRYEPLSVFSFFAGWLAGELALQSLVVGVAVTVVLGFAGAFSTWVGIVGLVIAVCGWAGLVGLAVVSRRAGLVVAAALDGASGGGIPRPPEPARPAWGRWWRLTQAVPLRGRAIGLEKNIDYWGDGIRRHRLDVIMPAGGVEHAPVMVYVHGGAWIIGNKEEQGKPMLYELVARGWVCVAINYRLSPRATWPDQIVDVKRALAWVKVHIAEYGGDPSFIALSGGSAGGHLSALAALSANDPAYQPGFESADTSVDACVPFYGVMDLTGADDGRYGHGLVKLLEKRVMKTTLTADRAVFEQASPTLRVHRQAPPFFVLHGTNDTLVPVAGARRFVEALRAVSAAPVAYAELPLAQHAFDVLASLRCQASTAGVITFLDAVRRGLPALDPATETSPPG